MNLIAWYRYNRPLWLGPLLLGIAGLIAVGIGTWQKPRYQRWKGSRALTAGRAALVRGDLDEAQVSLAVALRTRGDAEVYDAVGDYLERIGSERALDARRRAVVAAPEDSARKLAVVSTALRFGDTNAAQDALAGFSADERLSEPYRRASAALALLSGDFSAADRFLAGLNPSGDDFELRLMRDAIGLQDASAARRGAASRDLDQLSALPDRRLAALRVRLAAALRERDRLAALDLGPALAAMPHATFGDWLDAAAAEQLGRGAAKVDPSLLERIRTRARTAGSLAVKYARWVEVEQDASAAQAWLESLPPSIKEAEAAKAERAALAARREDWATLRRLLLDGAWGAMPAGAVDLAYAAFAAHRRGDEALALRAWEEALGTEGGFAEGLDGLSRLAAAWHWPPAMKSAFIEALRQNPNQPGLFRSYATYLRSQRDGPGLLALAEVGIHDSKDDARLANWGLLSFLIQADRAPPEALTALRSLATRQPGNPSYVTNYAFALWSKGRVREAAQLADRLPSSALQAPDRAPYLSAIYASAGRAAAARAALARAPRAAALLPEEAKLIADAYAKVAP